MNDHQISRDVIARNRAEALAHAANQASAATAEQEASNVPAGAEATRTETQTCSHAA